MTTSPDVLAGLLAALLTSRCRSWRELAAAGFDRESVYLAIDHLIQTGRRPVVVGPAVIAYVHSEVSDGK